jgi:heterodisulfide reductase subunit B
MQYHYYPGCSLHSSAKEYDDSLRAVCEALGIELNEMDGWICCGTSSRVSLSPTVGAALPLENLMLVEKAGGGDLVVPCPACLGRFKAVQHDLAGDPVLREKLERTLGRSYEGSVNAIHPLQVLVDALNSDDAKQKLTRSLNGLRVASYYGCVIVRPPEIMEFDDYEYPMSMDRIVRQLGGEPVDWSYKTECCGASFALTRTDIVRKLSCDIMVNARDEGADVICTCCQMCQANLDTRQREIEREFGVELDIPIVYYSQLIGLALGLDAGLLGLERHFVDPRPVFRERVFSQ